MSTPIGDIEPPQPGETARVVPVTDIERLWTPWRMRYVAGKTREDGCIFCNRLAEDDDARTLILHRGPRAFVIMNLFPYNTGHVMIVPNDHVASPEFADLETMAEMAALRAPVLRALRRALGCEGFNLGLNVGAVAGAGVTEHLHEHVVPRWQGDANFMPILAATMVLPELIPVTYAKLRAEIERELGGDNAITSIVVDPDGVSVLVNDEGEPPRATAADNEPLWRAALRDASERGINEAEVAGWGGQSRAGTGNAAIVLRAPDRATENLAAGNRFESNLEKLAGSHREQARAVLEQIRGEGSGSTPNH